MQKNQLSCFAGTSTTTMDIETVQPNAANKRAKWITFPFTVGTYGLLTLACGGWLASMIVYLIQEFKVKSIDAAQIHNWVGSGTSFSPLIGAILADSFLGSFSVVAISSCFSFLGTLVITLTSVIDSLRQKPCKTGSNTCESPSKFQYALLSIGLIMCCFGFGVSRFTILTFGANQFEKAEDQDRCFNWFFFAMYFFFVVSFTGVVYIQDNVNWGFGFGICLAATFIALIVFLSGSKFYRRDKPRGSPFTGLARVVVASIRKMKIPNTAAVNRANPELTSTFKFINKATIETEGDKNLDGSIAKPWRLCTVQQVEDFKKLIKILPIWSTAILVSLQTAIQSSLTVLQGLRMDRHFGGHFKIPAGSILVLSFMSTAVTLTFIDRFFPFLWRKVTGKLPTPLQKIRIGHVVVASSMVVSAMVENRRLGMNERKHEMLVTWLFPQLTLVGIGEAFYFPGQVAFYYQEFPVSLHGTATAMSSLILGIAYYLSMAFVDIVRACSDWLPNNINDGRVDNVFWVLASLGAINFGYFLCCAMFFTYKHNVDVTLVKIFSDSAN